MLSADDVISSHRPIELLRRPVQFHSISYFNQSIIWSNYAAATLEITPTDGKGGVVRRVLHKNLRKLQDLVVVHPEKQKGAFVQEASGNGGMVRWVMVGDGQW